MKDITIIIPVHTTEGEDFFKYLDRSINSVQKNRENYKGNLKILFVCANSAIAKCIKEHYNNNFDYNVIVNLTEDADFCSQINFAVDSVDTEYFSILEFDDFYTDKWFKSAKEYHYTNEDVSLFLPINVEVNDEDGFYQYINEMVWANEFSNKIGFIDNDCLDDFYGFNLTGGIFNTNDFKNIGKYKNDIPVAFNYELLLRLTNNNLKVFVVPKEGYCHLINRKDSLSYEYSKNISSEEVAKFFSTAKKLNSENK